MKKRANEENKSNKILKVVLKTLAIISAGVVGGYLALVLAFVLPLGRIHNNVLKSSAAFNSDYTFLIHDNLATKTDDYTDALMLMTAANDTDRNPFTAAVYDYYWGIKTKFKLEIGLKNKLSGNYSSKKYPDIIWFS